MLCTPRIEHSFTELKTPTIDILIARILNCQLNTRLKLLLSSLSILHHESLILFLDSVVEQLRLILSATPLASSAGNSKQ